jgi:hypothetical protein
MSEKVKSNSARVFLRLVTLKMSDVDMATIQLCGEKMNFILSKKDFKTGSRGYHAQGKMMAGGKNYQINILCVEIGSKPKEKEEKKK